tara:strand:+ start:530 stop:943 length:414 start_codon:yes stop_codon:yes gene_type:complete
MGRIICFDYGAKRVGIAVTDEQRIISTPLDTYDTGKIFNFIDSYIRSNNVDLFVVGLPTNLKGLETDATKISCNFIKTLKKKYKQIDVKTYDERFTSKMAKDSLIFLGKSKKYRRKKSNIDKVSASIILQSYLQRNT